MVIQRIQSVYLLIAIILMVVFAFFPALTFELGDKTVLYGALETGRAGNLAINPLLFTLTVLITLLALIDIFLYKNRPCQALVTLIPIVLLLAWYLLVGVENRNSGGSFTLRWTDALPAVAIVLTFLARQGIRADEKLVRSTDRIR